MNRDNEKAMMRRVAGGHDLRLDGISDLLYRAKDASVMDIGCNRALVAYEFANNGASLVHGCDIDEDCIWFSRHLFADLRNCESKFEVADLSQGARALRAFGMQRYDIVLCLATYHKLKRVTAPGVLSGLMSELGFRTQKWFGWRGTSEKANENEGELYQLDKDMKAVGLKRIHTSYISQSLGVAAIWERA